MLDKLSQALNLPKEEVYREEIKKTGGVSEIIAMREEAVPQFRRSWESGHLGQFVEDLGPHAAKGYHTVVCYYGSSGYDTAQMTRLIENIVQDCKAVGIETATDQEISLLLEGGIVHRRTKTLDISKKVKDRVWERDGGRCVLCGNPQAMPNAHYIPAARRVGD